MRDREIRGWVEQLTRSLGEPRPNIDPAPLEQLFAVQDYRGMLRMIREKLRLPIRITLALVNSGAPIGRHGVPIPAWIIRDTPSPLYGTPAFEEYAVSVYIRRAFIAESPYGLVSIALAHELCHVVLDAIRSTLSEVEEAVDLTAMLLGFRHLYARNASVVVERRVLWDEYYAQVMAGEMPTHVNTESRVVTVGYLTQEEIRYAVALMRT